MMKFRMQQFKLIVLAVAAGMVGPAFSEVTVSVESGERRLSASDISALGSSEDLVKTGAGRLVIDSALFPAGWTGAVKVHGGYLRVAHVGGLGPAGAKGAVVASGATIEFDGSALGTESLTCPKVAFQGTGADGVSAVRTVNANWEHKNMHWTLTGDATWGGASSKGELFRSGGSASIDMNGHKLTVRGNGTKNSIYFYTQVEKLIKNPGDIDVMDGVYFVTENMLFPGGSGHTLTFKDSCSWRITNNNKDQMTWKMVIEEGVVISWAAADWVTKYPNGTSRGWSGPIEIKSGARLSWSPGKNGSNPDEKIACTISGPISGDGEMALINNYLILDNKDNSIANILNYQGHLIATSLSAVLPSFTNGTFIGRYCNETGTRIMLAESEMGAVCDGAIQYYLTNYPAAYKYRYNDGSHSNPNIHIDFGAGYEISTRLDVAGTRYLIGAAYPRVATFTVGDGGVLDGGETAPSGQGILLGFDPLGGSFTARGILRLNEGGIISNRVASLDNVSTAEAPYSHGTFVINGGDYWYNDSSWQYGMVGHQIGGSVLMKSGTWRSNNWTCFGHGRNGYGAFEMLGGTFNHTANGAVGIGSYGGKAHMYIGGDASAKFCRVDTGFTVWAGSESSCGAYGVFTVDGNAEVDLAESNFGAASNSTTIVNLNGGLLKADDNIFDEKRISSLRDTNASASQADFPVADNDVYLNFNGGAIQLPYYFNNMKGASLNEVTVFENGANILLSAKNGGSGGGTLYKAFKAPTGKGVGTIPVPEVGAWEFSGSPLVVIEGDGWGASAFAQFDDEQGLVTNIVVTSPGCGYTWAKATLYRGGPTNDTEIVLDDYLVDNSKSGGMRVYGKGRLRHAVTHTYEGPTVVEGDAATTNEYWNGSQYPAKSPLRMAGGVCRFGMNGFANLASMNLTGLSGFGRVEAKDLTVSSLVFDAADILAGKKLELALQGKLILGENTIIKIKNAALIAEDQNSRFQLLTAANGITWTGRPTIDSDGVLPENWRAVVSNGGIRFGFYKKATMIVVR